MGTLNKRTVIFGGGGTAFAIADNDTNYLDFIQSDDFALVGWWMFPATVPSAARQVMMSKQVNAISQGYRYWYENGRFHFFLRDGSANEIEIAVGAVGEFDDQQAHHVVAIWNGSAGTTDANASIWVDGVEQDGTGGTTRNVITPDTLTATLANVQPFAVGAIATTVDNVTNGSAAFLCVYGIALTGADVLALFGNGDPANPLDAVSTDPLGLWPIDFDPYFSSAGVDIHLKNLIANGDAMVHFVVADFSRNGHGLTHSNVNAASFTIDTPGGISQRAFEGNNSGRLRKLDDAPHLKFDVGDEFSVSFWWKSNVLQSCALVSKYDVGLGDGWQVTFSGSTGAISLSIVDTGSFATVTSNTGDISDDVWRHCVATFSAADPANVDNTDMEMWLNAVDVSDYSGNNSFPASGSFDHANGFYQVGGRDDGNLLLRLQQHVAEVQLFDRKLTGTEIAEIYNAGVPKYPADWFGPLAPINYCRPAEDFHHLDMGNMFEEDILIGGVAVGDTGGAPPVITNFSPPEGTELGRFQTVGFDITDPEDALKRALPMVAMGGFEIAMHDGDTFVAGFTGNRVPITGGFRYTVKPVNGWLPGNDAPDDGPDFKILAYDTSGQEAV